MLHGHIISSSDRMGEVLLCLWQDSRGHLCPVKEMETSFTLGQAVLSNVPQDSRKIWDGGLIAGAGPPPQLPTLLFALHSLNHQTSYRSPTGHHPELPGLIDRTQHSQGLTQLVFEIPSQPCLVVRARDGPVMPARNTQWSSHFLAARTFSTFIIRTRRDSSASVDMETGIYLFRNKNL